MRDGTPLQPAGVSRRTLLHLGIQSAAWLTALAACAPPPSAPPAPAPPGPAAANPPQPQPSPMAQGQASPVAQANAAPAQASPVAAPARAAGTETRQIVIAQASEWTSLDPTLVPLTPNRNVLAYMFDPLIHRTRDGKLVGKLATRWERVNDTTWRFSLREGVTFHNGEPLDAAAVKFTLDRMIKPDFSQHAGIKTTVVGTRVVDHLTVEVETKAPDPSLIGVMTDTVFVVPPKYVQEQGDGFVAANPVGTGRYTFKEWQKGDHLTMSAHRSYWGGVPPIETIVFRPIPEPATRVAGLRTGELDVVDDVPPSQAVQLKTSDAIVITDAPAPQTNYMGLRPKIEPLKNVKVRQAINYAVNRDLIIEKILFGYATAQGHPLPQGFFGYSDEPKPYPYDPQKAKQLLQEAGYGGGFTLHLDYSTFVPQGKQVAEAVAGDLKEVGIEVEQRYMESGAYMKVAFPPGQAELAEAFFFYIKGAGLDANDIYSTSFRLDGVWNYAEFKNEQVDQLVRKAGSTFDEQERLDLYRQLNQLLHDEAPWLYLFQSRTIVGVKKGVDFQARPDGMLWLYD